MTPLLYAGLDSHSRLSFQNRNQDPVLETVITITGVSREELQCQVRLRRYVIARCLACHFLKLHTKKTLLEIGETVGYTNHTTVLYQLGQYKSLYQYEAGFREIADAVRERLVAIGMAA